MTKIKVGTREESFRMPEIVVKYEIAGLLSVSQHRAALAALGACVPRLAKIAGLRYEDKKGDAAAYALVLGESLGKLGLSYQEALEAGMRALALVGESLVSPDDIEKAVGNSLTAEED